MRAIISAVILSAAKDLNRRNRRSFAAASNDTPVTLSEAKGLKMRNSRSFAALRRLRMTGHSRFVGAQRRLRAQDDGPD
jgi:hypothetical protein